MKVMDIMTRRVIAASPEATIRDAIQLMLTHRISGLPVIDGNRNLVGVVSEGDFLRRAETATERKRSRWFDAFFGPGGSAEAFVHSHGTHVKDVMTQKPVTIVETAPLEQAVHLMESRNIKRLPVVRRGKVVGMITRANLMRALASVHRGARDLARRDGAIRKRILADLAQQSWSSGASVDVLVRKGVADIWGSIGDPAQREAIKVLVESTPGVKQSYDHLIIDAEPASVT
jgi:CBS domain-containing protein